MSGSQFSNRRSFLKGSCALTLSTFGSAAFATTTDTSLQKTDQGIAYLEKLAKPGALSKGMPFRAPSEIDPTYSHVIYVNTALRGHGAQKMWILQRSGSASAGWKLALWDETYWAKKGLAEGAVPPYSWPVSTGRVYPGNKRSGPTPVGIFNMDDRRTRHRRGWGSQGMYNSIYIDLHYSSGRASGIAMHGTTRGMYRRLGRADSHGCVRMTQQNSQQVWDMFHPKNTKGDGSPFWGKVPRYFKSAQKQDYSARYGYVRDGSFLYSKPAQNADRAVAQVSERLLKSGYTALFVFFRDDS